MSFHSKLKRTWIDNETIPTNAVSYAAHRNKLQYILSPCAVTYSVAKKLHYIFIADRKKYIYIYIYIYIPN